MREHHRGTRALVHVFEIDTVHLNVCHEHILLSTD
jgi:hypothetical protein